MNIAILLAGGLSTRFGSIKQLALIHGIPAAYYSLKVVGNNHNIQHIIVVVNRACDREIINIADNLKIKNIQYVYTSGSRYDSIMEAHNAIQSMKITADRILIHDVARPLITTECVETLISSNSDYCTYYMTLRNGLALKSSYDTFDKELYIETCTPLIIRYSLFNQLNSEYPKQEYLPHIQKLGKNIQLIEGNIKTLYKLTYKEDLDIVNALYQA